MAVLVLAALSVQPVAGQEGDGERRRERDRDRDRIARAFVTSFSARDQQARMGIYLDVHQPTRYDDRGARLTGVAHDSPADEAGLEEGDIVTHFNGQSLTDRLADAESEEDLDPDESMPAQRLLALARDLEDGDEVRLDYIRDGQSYSATVVAEEDGWPGAFAYSWSSDDEPLVALREVMRERGQLAREQAAEARALAERARGMAVVSPRADFFIGGGIDACPSGGHLFMAGDRGCLMGAEVRELEPALGEYFEAESGVLVLDVSDENPLGLMPGDVIVQVGDRETDSIGRVRRLLRSYDEDETVRVTVIRKGARVVLEGTLDR
jgi:S1-C subfamily serine protease